MVPLYARLDFFYDAFCTLSQELYPPYSPRSRFLANNLGELQLPRHQSLSIAEYWRNEGCVGVEGGGMYGVGE